jgi:SOS-response transcriptional repressor LexA
MRRGMCENHSMSEAVKHTWIKQRLTELGKSQASLGVALGVDRSAVTNIIKGTRQIKADEVGIVARHLELSEQEVITHIGSKLSLVGDRRPLLRPADVSGIMVRGAVQAGVWKESLEWDESDWYTVPMPSEDPRYPGIPLFGLEVRGPSMNKVFPEGTILACVHLIHAPVDVEPGRYVIAEQVNEHGEFESTVKQLRKDADGTYWLWPCSDDPRYQTPLKVNGGKTCRITALVVRSSRPE